MISPYTLLKESGFAQYTAMARFTYDRENTSLGAEKLAEMVRAIPGSTRVTTVSLDKDNGIAIFQVKLISAKTPKAAFVSFKENALKKFKGMLLKVEIGAGTIEKKGDFILKEEKQVRPQTNLGQFLGQLLEEGLLLEVSIEELRRQYVECDPPKISAEVFEQIVQTCENKSNYATWLCKKVADELIPVEDFGGWHDLFQFFDRYKQRFQKKDINQVKTAEDIEAFKRDYEQAKEAVAQKKEGGKKEELEPCQIGIIKTCDKKVWKVYKTGPGQWPLERKIGSGAKWCTVAGQDMFDHYLKRGGNYYIFVNKDNPSVEKYQIHIESNQCANIGNESMLRRLEENPFIIEFYDYLHEKEGKEIPGDVVRAKESLENLKRAYEGLKDAPSVLDQFEAHELPCGAKYYKLLESQDQEALSRNALLFRDLQVFEGTYCVVYAKRFLDTRSTYYVLITNDSKKDIVTSTYHYGGDVLCSTLSGQPNQLLPLCTENNLDSYLEISRGPLGVAVNPKVIIRCNKNLPNLEHYKWREADTRTGYKFPKADIESQRAVRAFHELEAQTGTELRIADDEDMLVCVDTDLGMTTSQNQKVIQAPPRWNSSAANADKMVKVVRFLGLTPDQNSNDRILERLGGWLAIGRWQGILEALRNPVEIPGVDNTKMTVSDASRLVPIMSDKPANERCYAVYVPGDISQVYIISSDKSYFWSPANSPTTIADSCYRQYDFGRLNGIRPKDLGVVYQHFNLTPPPPLERLLGRTRPGERPNVLQALRANMDHLVQRSIPLHQYTRGWRAGTPYEIRGRGLYGTWEQLGPLIRQSSPEWYERITRQLGNYPNHEKDVFLYFHNDNSRHTWNGAVRAINPETHRVDYYARRYGDGMGVQWITRELEPEERALAGERGEGNYVAPQPRPERAPRQRRQAQAAPAVPAPALEGLDQYRVNSHYSDGLYVIPQEEVVRVTPGAGFTNAARNGDLENCRAVIYQPVENPRGITRVMIISDGERSAVLGLPHNPTATLAFAESAQARFQNLYIELGNHLGMFRQCLAIHREQNIPVSAALQNWIDFWHGRGRNVDIANHQ